MHQTGQLGDFFGSIHPTDVRFHSLRGKFGNRSAANQTTGYCGSESTSMQPVVVWFNLVNYRSLVRFDPNSRISHNFRLQLRQMKFFDRYH